MMKNRIRMGEEGGHQIRNKSVTCYDSGSVRVVAVSAFPVPDAERAGNQSPKTSLVPNLVTHMVQKLYGHLYVLRLTSNND